MQLSCAIVDSYFIFYDGPVDPPDKKSVKSLLFRWPLRPVGLSFSIIGRIASAHKTHNYQKMIDFKDKLIFLWISIYENNILINVIEWFCCIFTFSIIDFILTFSL